MENTQQNETVEQSAGSENENIQEIQQQTPVMPIYPVRPMPFDPFCPQLPVDEALEKGTLFKWLYDPYVPERPMRRRRGLFG